MVYRKIQAIGKFLFGGLFPSFASFPSLSTPHPFPLPSPFPPFLFPFPPNIHWEIDRYIANSNNVCTW